MLARREMNPRLLLLDRFQIEGRLLLLATDAAAPIRPSYRDSEVILRQSDVPSIKPGSRKGEQVVLSARRADYQEPV